MRALLLAVVLAPAASAAKLVEIPTLPQAVVPSAGPAAAIAAEPASAAAAVAAGATQDPGHAGGGAAAAAPLGALFDHAAAYDPRFWGELEASLLSGVGSTDAARPGA